MAQKKQTIWTLRIECVYGPYIEEDCVRVVELDAGTSLLELHNVIQRAVDFDFDHLYEFFAGRHERDRRALFGDSYDYESRFGDYEEITLDRVYPLAPRLKLYYNFDFGDNWLFVIKKSRKKPREPEPGVKYPRIVESIGPNPPQYDMYDDEEEEEEW